MTAAAVPAGTSSGGLAQRVPEWLGKNLVGLIVTAVVSGAVGYIVNVWLMAVRYEGSVTPEGAPAMSKDNSLAGGVFWAMFPMVVCSAIGYRRAVGKERFWRDVRRLPIVLVGLFRRDGSQGWVHLLWGAAIALAATLVVPPAVGAVLGVGLLIGAPTIVGSLLATVFAQLWRFVGRIVAPTKDHRVAPILKIAVGILGWALALVLGFVLPGEWIRLVLALTCAVGAFALGRRGAASPAVETAVAAVAMFAVGAFVIELLTAVAASADDGGFAECGSTLEGWLRSCAGAGEVRRRALLGGIVGTQGGAVGFVGGGVVGLLSATTGGPWWDRLDLDTLPGGMLDPATGESLVVNDGRWSEAPVGHVYFQGQWAHPEAVGAVPDYDDPFTPDADEDDPAAHPALWLPPLVAVAVAGVQVQGGAAGRSAARSARRATRQTDAPPEAPPAGDGAPAAGPPPSDGAAAVEGAAAEGAAAEGQELLRQADRIRTELAGAASDADRTRLQAEFRAKALEIAGHPAARQAVAADTSAGSLGADLTTELNARDTEVMGVFVERMNELGVTRAGQPIEASDVNELRQRVHGVRPGSEVDVTPGNLRNLWKGYGSKKGRFAIDAATYLRFLQDRRDDPATSDEDRTKLENRIARLQQHVDDGVTTVMVSEQIWNEVAQYAYALAERRADT